MVEQTYPILSPALALQGLVITPQDSLVLSGMGLGGENVILRAKYLDPHGIVRQLEQRLAMTGGAAYDDRTIPLYHGQLLFLVLQTPTANVVPGDLYVECTLRTNGTARENISYCFSQGYLHTFKTIQWPPGEYLDFLQPHGSQKQITTTAPAAGAGFTMAVGTSFFYRHIALKFLLTTSGVAASRRPSMEIQSSDGASVYYRATTGQETTASSTDTYNFATDVNTRVSIELNSMDVAVPKFLLRDNMRLSIAVDNMQAADQISAIFWTVESLRDPN